MANFLVNPLAARKSRFLGCYEYQAENKSNLYIKEALFGNKEEKCVVNVSAVIDYACSGFSVCPITADIGIFGDPKCPEGVDKFLFVDYWCGTKGKHL